MAERLVLGGFTTLGLDLSPARGAALVAVGGRLAGSIGELADAADAVLVSVPGPVEQEAILLGEEGLIARMRSGTAIISASTVTDELMLRIGAAAAARGVDVLDAPVTGAADGARAGTLTFMVGADADALERWRHVLEPLARTVVHTGPIGTGSAAKLLTNLLWFTHVVALCDSLAAAAKSGITPQVMRELVPVSAGASWVSEHDMENLFAGEDDESFTLALCCKDLRLIRGLTDASASPITLLDGVEGRFVEAMARFGPAAGELAVSRLAEERIGASIRLAVR
jgi:3-hydroxyisobutyrate dehydrogenase